MHSMLFSVLAFAALLLPTQALYFYIDGPSQKCFFEELPKDTLVVGEYLPLSPSSPSTKTLTLNLRSLHRHTMERAIPQIRSQP
jgi:hypothetical protein